MNSDMYRWEHLPWETIERQVYKLAIHAFTKPHVVAKRTQSTNSNDSYSTPGQPHVLPSEP
jgi:hypothetical protein